MANPRGVNQYTNRTRRRKRTPKGGPRAPVDKGGQISRVRAAAVMYGTGSPQHKAAIKRWGRG